MRKLRVVTNESLERYIDYLSMKVRFEATHRRIKFEDRFSSLDLDDITADVTAPTDGEINTAVRELDLFDDIAIKTGAKDVEVGGDGKLRLLDLDEPVKKKRISGDKDDARFSNLDLDDPNKRKRKRTNTNDTEDNRVRELDLDDKGADNTEVTSNVGAIGALDYDDDIDTSGIAASIEDVYAALSSDDPNTVKSIIKRYAQDIKDKDKIRDAMLVHATNLNLECLRALCGDMKITLTPKEKKLEFIDINEIKSVIERLKKIATTLTGANNTFGLIPNAIVACGPDDQVKCMNVIDFLKEWCGLPIIPIYFRGAMIRRCYDLANYLFDEINGEIPLDLYIGPKGLVNRMKSLNDIPPSLTSKIVGNLVKFKGANSHILGDTVIALANNNDNSAIKKLLKSVSRNRRDMIIDYIDDTDMAVSQLVAKLIK